MIPKILLFVCIVISPYIPAFSQELETRIDSLMNALYQREQFKGSALVSVDGKVVYKNAYGQSNFGSRKTFSPATVFNIASLTKAFTAMSIMMLAEENKLRYTDPIEKYLPELKKQGITIRHLLTHTSGIPDVGDLGIDDENLTNNIALKRLQQPANFRAPGQKYQYSNTGYLLLATIVERVSGQKFVDFLEERILLPLGMKNTYLSGKTVGMGDMHSNVDDLLKWEQSFYTEKLVRSSTLDSAFTPYPVKEGSSTYGFGWNIVSKEGDRFIWHTGNSGNNRAFIGRRLKEKIAVIILSEGDSKRMEMNDAIVAMTQGRPYKLPKMSITNVLYTAINKEGVDNGIALYHSLKKEQSGNYEFGEQELNSLGYRLMGDKKNREAIKVFELNTIFYPASSNAFDSLAESWMATGNKEQAIKFYKKAIELDPYNENAKSRLKKLSE